MTLDHDNSNKRDGTAHDQKNEIAPSARQELNGRLTDFQQRILYILAEESRYGLAVKRALERVYGVDINHGRLYPNLDTLVDLGLVEKGSLDDRTNTYQLTDRGRQWCREDTQWRLGKLGHDPDHEELRQAVAAYATGGDE